MVFNEEIKELAEEAKNGMEISLICPLCSKELEFSDEMNDADKTHMYCIVVYSCPDCLMEMGISKKIEK
jgi:uncharacterized Zn finger protein